MTSPSEDNTQSGLSAKIKIPVVILTIATLIAFAAFFAKLTGLVSTPKGQKAKWNQQILIVADKLKEVGLHEQAIVQYARFLEREDIESHIRARASHDVGELYLKQGNCREALSWLFQAEVAGPDSSIAESLTHHIDTCLHQIQAP